MSHLRLLFFLLMAVAVQAGYCVEPNDRLRREPLMEFDSPTLLRKADSWRKKRVNTDSAMLCYTIVAQRYSRSMSRDEKQLALRGWLGRWETLFYGYCDYSSALDDLLSAEEIARECNLDAAKIDYGLGCTWAALATYNDDRDSTLVVRALNYMRSAFLKSVKSRDFETAHNSFDNLSSLACLHGDLSHDDIEEFEVLKSLGDNGDWRMRASIHNYQGWRAIARDSMRSAIDHYTRLLAEIPADLNQSRYRAMAVMTRGQLYTSLGEYRRARVDLDSAMALSFAAGAPDARIVVLRSLMDWAVATGDSAFHRVASNHLYQLQDSLQYTGFLLKTEHLNLERETLDIKRQMIESELRRRVSVRMAWGAVGVTVVVAFLALLLFRSNRRLRERNLALFRRVKEAAAPSAPPKVPANTIAPDESQRLASEIHRIIENSEEVFSTEFSLQRLAELTGSNTSYVSQTVNREFGMSFPRLLSKVRIAEACRRMADTRNYGRFSTEGIAESVGFNSRSAFYDAFKRITGLSVGEYRRMAERESPGETK